MAIPNSQVDRFTPRGLVDAFDATDRFPGACLQLTNLIFDQSNPELVVTRPGVTLLADLATLGILGPQFICIHIAVGTRVYGMVGTLNFPGNDEPFCVDLSDPSAPVLVPITGATALNTPISQQTTGEWIPPTMAVVGTMVVVTTPGFTNLPKWLWGTTVLGGSNKTWGSTLTLDSLAANADLVFTAISPIAGAITVVMHNTGVTNALSVSVVGLAITVTLATTAGTITSTANDVKTAIDASYASNFTTVAVGGSGAGLVDAFETPQPFTGVRWGDRYTFGVIDITDPDAPVWDSGTTIRNPLTGAPSSVANFGNRAWFAVGNLLEFTDVLTNPLTMTSATQQITVGDDAPIVAQSGLPVQTTGSGMLQTLTIFKETQVWQVGGDQATWNLSLSYTSLNIGTNAPRTLCQSPYGLYFNTTGGAYFLDLMGTLRPVTHSQGELEPDVQSPFATADVPSRWCGGFNSNVYRVAGVGIFRGHTLYGDYWFDEHRRRWNGPHSFVYDCVSPLGGYFVLSSRFYNGQLLRSAAQQKTAFVDQDMGQGYNCNLVSSTFPKLGWLTTKQVVESTIELGASGGDLIYQVYALDEQGRRLGRATIPVHVGGVPWGSFDWGDGTPYGTSDNWGGGSAWGPQALFWGTSGANWFEYTNFWTNKFGSGLRWGTGHQSTPLTYPVQWTAPLVFEKMLLRVDVAANAEVAIGTFYARMQKTGYMTFGPQVLP